MTREEKIDAIISAEVFTGNRWGSEKDFLHYVALILREGFNGYENMTDTEINEVYNGIFEQDEAA